MKGFKAKFNPVAMMAVLLMLMLVACGVNAPASEPSASGGNANSEAVDNETRAIEHAMGTTNIQGKPARIVILSNEGTEALLALGVTPVGAVKSWLGDPWYAHIAEQMQEVTLVGDEMQPNLEVIAGLKPDLILGVKVRQEKVYDQLSRIAPTVFSESLSGNWKSNFMLYAEAVGEKDKGEQLLAEFDGRAEQAKTELGDRTSSEISIVRFLPEGARIYFKESFSGVLLDQLGFARPQSQNKPGLAEEITKERIPEMDGDYLFYFVWEDDLDARTGARNAEEWKKETLWKGLRAVQANRVFEVQDAIWNTSGGILSANLMLDELMSHFR